MATLNKDGVFTVGKKMGKGSNNPHGKKTSMFEVVLRHVQTKRLLRTRHVDHDRAVRRVHKATPQWEFVSMVDHTPKEA
jgi:hypothetical protein